MNEESQNAEIINDDENEEKKQQESDETILINEKDPTAILLSKIKDPIEHAVVAATARREYDKAEQIAKDAERYDILAQFNRSLGKLSDAISITSLNDRVHRNSMMYIIARVMEVQGDIPRALKFYENAGALPKEITRLASLYGPKLVFEQVKKKGDTSKDLLNWIARFYEAQNRFDDAMEYFDEAHNELEVVRLLCLRNKWDEAELRVNRVKRPSVYCLYARLLMKRIKYMEESSDDRHEEAGELKHTVIEHFRKARQFGPAMVYAMENGMTDYVLQLSYSAPKQILCRAAEWFTALKQPKNAILMYSRAGQVAKSLALCFELKRYDALEEICDSLDTNTNPRVLIQISHYLAESERWSKAAQCLAFAGKFKDVIELCRTHNIKLQQSVIDKISETDLDPKLTETFAELCEQQNQFLHSSKLYIKLKQYEKALKALARAGETDKILKIAKVINKKETYILAANYLQTLGTKRGSEMFNEVVSMYKKAGAKKHLEKFLQTVEQLEADEKENENEEEKKEKSGDEENIADLEDIEIEDDADIDVESSDD